MLTKYKPRMESEGKKVMSGTGFKFAEAEANLTTEKNKYQKAALGLKVSNLSLIFRRLSSQLFRTLMIKMSRRK